MKKKKSKKVKKPKNKDSVLMFLLGLVVGNRGLVITWHIFYWIVIGMLVWCNWK